jgi:hypothetical protein
VPRWLRNSLVISAVAGGALLLWVGFALLVAALLIVAIPFSLWSALARRRRAPEGPITVEGSSTRVDEKIVLEQPPAGKREARTDLKDPS